MAKKASKAVSSRVRGSAQLASQPINQADLQKLVALGQKQGIKLVHWQIYGQPAPDGVSGAFQVRPHIANTVLGTLIKIRGLGVDVFPYGIPVPRETMIRFSSRGALAGGVVVHG